MPTMEAPAFVQGEEPLVAVWDIGGTKSSAAVGGEHIDPERIVTLETCSDPEENAARLAEATLELTGGRRPDLIGSAVAGEVSENGLTIVRAGQLRSYGWLGKPIKAMIADANGLPIERAEIINDVESAGWAQREADRRRRMQYLLRGGQGYIETVSSGTNGAIYDLSDVVNVESGHISSGEEAPVQCGCGGTDCVEAHIGGNPVAEAWGKRMEQVDVDDTRWDAYQRVFARMQVVKLDALRERGFNPKYWYMFGSVSLKGPRNVLGDFASQLVEDPEHAMPVAAATYGDESGLYGTYFAVRDRQRLVA